jgi:hypothetical protein
MPEDELRADLISQCMVPALEKMSQALSKESPCPPHRRCWRTAEE